MAPQVGEASALSPAACLFHGFSDPNRVAIVRHLALGEHRVVDLTAHLGLAQSTVSKHLACLRDCGLVTSRPQGRASMWSLNHTDTIMNLLAAAERLLDLTGVAVTLCPNFGTESGMHVATAHLVTNGTQPGEAVLTAARTALRQQHGVDHATLQVEASSDRTCQELGW